MLLTTNPANTAPGIRSMRWEKALTTTPTNAEISIVPSSAILLVPDLDEIIAPSVVKSTGVALRNIAK